MSRNGAGVYSLPPIYEATAGQTATATQHNTPLEDIEADLNIARPVVAGGTGASTESGAATSLQVVSYGSAQTLSAAQQAQARSNVSAALKGHLHGLILSNNSTDATNDIDIAAGEAASTETDPVLMILSAGITKRLDAAWAAGTNQGGLDTGSPANTTYHVWLIQRSDTGAVDVLFSVSATAPTMPTNYDRKRRIGSFLRESAAIVSFRQFGDVFKRTPVSDYTTTSAVTDQLFALSVPSGVQVGALITYTVTNGTSTATTNLSLGDGTGSTADTLVARAVEIQNKRASQVTSTGHFYTNIARQLRISVANTVSPATELSIITQGWIDTRGRVS